MNRPALRSNLYRLYYLLTLIALCCYDSYISVYLEQYLHLSGFQIGCFLSVSMIAGLVVMPLYGALGDRTGKYREILMVCSAGTILFSFLLSMQTGFFLLIVMGIGFELNRCSILAMADTQTIRYCSDYGQPYGSIRCFGCVGWITGSALCAFLVRRFGLDQYIFPLFHGRYGLLSGEYSLSPRNKKRQQRLCAVRTLFRTQRVPRFSRRTAEKPPLSSNRDLCSADWSSGRSG